MENSLDEIYFTIAGFNFLLKFNQIDWFTIKEDLKRNITNYLQDFIVKRKPDTIEYFIDFIWEDDSEIIFIKKQNINYIRFYKNIDKSRIECSYRISLVEFQLILLNVLNTSLSNNHGFILHSSSVFINKQADIFLGPSGAGKSTIINLLKQKYHVLSDDKIIVKKERDKYFVYQTPFIEKEYWVKKNYKKYFLGRLIFLKKSEFFALDKLPEKEKVTKQLLKQLITDKETYPQQLKYLLEFIESCNNFFLLRFGRNQSKLIDVLN